MVFTRAYKYAAFADDILLFLKNLLITLPNVLSEFKQFQSISNLKINLSKSYALNISLPQTIVDQCKVNFPFQWKHDSITYLSIQIPSKLSDLYVKNHLPLLNKLTTDLKNWNKPLFSWFGRAAILKMNVLPRILYLLQMIPIHIPPSFFKVYRQLCSKFLWSDHTHRISYTQLTRPKHLGGIGLPNLQNYQIATLLTRIVDWNIHSLHKDWVTLEASFTNLSLSTLPWISLGHVPLEIRLHPLIGPTIQCFHQTCKKTTVSSIPGPLTPLKLNPDFPPGMHPLFLTDQWPSDHVRAHHFFQRGKILSAAQIASNLKKVPIPLGHIY